MDVGQSLLPLKLFAENRTRERRGRRNPFVIIQRELLGNNQSCETASEARGHMASRDARFFFSFTQERPARLAACASLQPIRSGQFLLPCAPVQLMKLLFLAPSRYSPVSLRCFADHSLSLSLSRSKTFSSYPNLNACKGMEHDVREKFEFLLTKREKDLIVANCGDRMSRFNPRFIPVHTG